MAASTSATTPASAAPSPAAGASPTGTAVRAWLGWFALAVIIGMQAGTVFRPLGDVGETRIADWVDLLTPLAVLGSAAVVMLRARATRSQWVLFGLGGIAFSTGKVVAGLVALTLVNTYIEGAQPVLGLVFLATLFVTGLVSRPDPVSRLLLVVGGLGLLLLVGWGAYWIVTDGVVFPEFSELGWI